jgi:hypothetical protein
MAIGQGGRHESFKWGRAALTATNDEIVTLVTLGWDIGRVVESGDPLDEAMEKAVADYKATMSQLDKADLMASLVVSKIMQGEPYTLATERDFEGRLQSIADHVGATMEISWLDQADQTIARTGVPIRVFKFTPSPVAAIA